MSSKRIVIIVLAAVVGLSAVFFAGFLVADHYYVKWEESQDIAFDVGLWKTAGILTIVYASDGTHMGSPRVRMYRDLIANQPWKGKEKWELKMWLGEPISFPFGDGWDFNYRLGPERGLIKWNYVWLAFRFDGDGRAVEAKVLQD